MTLKLNITIILSYATIVRYYANDSLLKLVGEKLNIKDLDKMMTITLMQMILYIQNGTIGQKIIRST